MVLKKDEHQQDTIIMATPKEMGHDHTGRLLKKPNSDVLWDDLAEVVEEIEDPDSSENKHVFTVPWKNINSEVLVPRFYREIMAEYKAPDGCFGIKLGNLVKDGIIGAWDGHGSPEAKYKGLGDVPYIRVADIVNWELYRNPTSGIPEEEYLRVFGKNGKKTKEGDIIFVRRGSYRIGTVAMASPMDSNVLLTRELLTLRIIDNENEYAITPFYLLAMISSKSVQDQIPNFVCIDTTLPNLGDRWKHLILPIHKDKEQIKRISLQVESSIKNKWLAQKQIDKLRDEYGGVTT